MNPKEMEPVGDGADDCALRLSCLLDGELDDEACRQIFEQLRRDEEACRDWALLNCVGDALRSADVAAWHSEGFVARVSTALQKEPTILAPAARSGGRRRWLLPGAGAAIAATLLIVVGLPSRQATEPEAAVAGKAEQPAAIAVAPRPIEVVRSPLLERYLAAHRELAEPTVMPYSTPYVRTSGTLPAQEPR